MISDLLKAKVLIAVAEGATYSEAAKHNGLNDTQGRTAVVKICQMLKLSSDLTDIKANPALYLASAQKIANTPRYALRGELRKQLEQILRLRSQDELTPEYLSNFSATTLLDNEISTIALADIQEWLVNNGTSLKRGKLMATDMHSVKTALWVLDAFGFNVKDVLSQFSSLSNEGG
jgi:hypothetical protein